MNVTNEFWSAMSNGHLPILQWLLRLIREERVVLEPPSEDDWFVWYGQGSEDLADVLAWLHARRKELCSPLPIYNPAILMHLAQNGHRGALAWWDRQRSVRWHVHLDLADTNSIASTLGTQGMHDILAWLHSCGSLSVPIAEGSLHTCAHHAAAEGHVHLLAWIAAVAERSLALAGFGGRVLCEGAQGGHHAVVRWVWHRRARLGLDSDAAAGDALRRAWVLAVVHGHLGLARWCWRRLGPLTTRSSEPSTAEAGPSSVRVSPAEANEAFRESAAGGQVASLRWLWGLHEAGELPGLDPAADRNLAFQRALETDQRETLEFLLHLRRAKGVTQIDPGGGPEGAFLLVPAHRGSFRLLVWLTSLRWSDHVASLDPRRYATALRTALPAPLQPVLRPMLDEWLARVSAAIESEEAQAEAGGEEGGQGGGSLG